MRSIAIFGGCAPTPNSETDPTEVVEIDGTPVRCGLVRWNPTGFDENAEANREWVLVKKRGFACNFRDRGLILEAARFAARDTCYIVGSEFVGEVVATGLDVVDLRAGDRVIGNYSYPLADSPAVKAGVPSNHTSLELEAFHRAKLMAIPPAMPDRVAAGFTIGAQTSYSMVRRLELSGGERVLVTSGRSSTSLFLIAALRPLGAEVYVTTTSGPAVADRFGALGVRRVFRLGQGSDDTGHDELREVAVALGGFGFVLDPFFDLNLKWVVNLMSTGGKYVTCGFFGQAPHVGMATAGSADDLLEVMRAVMLKNLRLIGNCSGRTGDLAQAIQDYAAGRFQPLIDRVYSERQATDWLRQTFVSPDRFGKCPMLYGS